MFPAGSLRPGDRIAGNLLGENWGGAQYFQRDVTITRVDRDGVTMEVRLRRWLITTVYVEDAGWPDGPPARFAPRKKGKAHA
jgi:hypothetical protein